MGMGQYEVLLSRDGTHFTSVGSAVSDTKARSTDEKGVPLSFTLEKPAAARYVQFRVKKHPARMQMILAEAAVWGDRLPQGVDRTVWLPEGVRYDYFTRERFEGNRFISRTSDIQTFPLYVRSGAIIPITSIGDYVSKPLSDLTIQVYASAESVQTDFDLYEDQGENFDYEKGLSRRTRLVYDHSEEGPHRIIVEAARGSYPEAVSERDYTIEVIGLGKTSSVWINGVKTEDWSREGDLLSIPCGTHAVSDTLNIEIR